MRGEPTLDAAGRTGPPLRRDGAFRRYWLARVISLLGSAVTYVALPVLVYQVTGSGLWTALVTFAEGAPYLDVLSFVGSALLLRAVTRPFWDPAGASRHRRLVAEIHDGITFLWRQRIVRTTTLVGATQAFTGGLFIGQLVPWADQVLGVPPGDGRLGDRLHGRGARRDHPAAAAHP
jgi:hypothetical protein